MNKHERHRIASRRWRELNPDKQKKANRAYYDRHREALIFQQKCRNAGVKPPQLGEIEMTGAALLGTRKILREVVWYKSIWGRVPTTFKRAKNPKGKVTRAELHLTCGHVLNLPLARLTSKKFNCKACVEARDRKISH